MGSSNHCLSPSEAARRLGVSTKALRLYEQHGLVVPMRTAAGWRAYGPAEMTRCREIVALRGLGFSLAQVGRVLGGDPHGLDDALRAHEAALGRRLAELQGTLDRVRRMRGRVTSGDTPAPADLVDLACETMAPVAAFDLPWPWGGERFELRTMRPLTYITGPLASGKTRLAKRLAEALPGAAFIGLDRPAADARTRLATDPTLDARVRQALAWLVEDGAVESDALLALATALEAPGPAVLVVDLVEQGLDEATQTALMARLRARGPGARPLVLMTRSTAILDLEAAGPDEAVLFCPANHAPPSLVAPHPGAPGYEAMASCLAAPEVRARTEGVIAVRA